MWSVAEMKETCPDCEGAGWTGKLYPSGHHEVTCDRCSGEGFLDFDDDCEHDLVEYQGLIERFYYCKHCDERIK